MFDTVRLILTESGLYVLELNTYKRIAAAKLP